MRFHTTGRGWRRSFCALGQHAFNVLGARFSGRCYRIADWFGERAR